MQLRNDQQIGADRVMRRICERPIYLAPTGSGKTVIARALIERALAKNLRCLFLVHRKELVTQARDRFAGLPVGIIKAGFDEHRCEPVQIASVQTLSRRAKPTAHFVIVDECHHAVSKSWATLIRHYMQAPRPAYLLGLSATPSRLDGRGLGQVFGCIVQGSTTAELCAAGVLTEPTVYSHPCPDLSKVRVLAGDYAEDALVEAMDRGYLVGDIVKHWTRLAPKRTVAFAVNIAHSQHIAKAFTAAGITAEHIDGTTPTDVRDATIASLADGSLSVLSNCMLLGEGWDLPALDCAILARPTMSLALHRQQIGRIMRACEGKEGALVLDHAGNTMRHGLVTDEPMYSLEGRVKVPKPAPTKTCPGCYRVCMAGVRVCPECGHEFRTETQRPDTAPGELELVSQSRFRETAYAKLVMKASSKGMRLGWARFQYKDRFGEWPRLPDIESLYRCHGHEWEHAAYGRGEKCTRCLTRKPIPK